MPQGERRDGRRPVDLRRSWLFLAGADEAALAAAPESGADVLIQELEDFVAPDRRSAARALCRPTIEAWKATGRIAAVRINPIRDSGPLASVGAADLAAAMAAAPHVVMLPKVADPGEIAALDRLIADHETRLGLAPGSTEIVPNIESARGLVRTVGIAGASPRVSACLVASEDMAEDLGAERGRDGVELNYVRARFLVECRAAGVVAIDCPYTWRDRAGVVAEARHARRLGYTAKSAVVPGHAKEINRVFTPSPAEVRRAEATVAAFEAARAGGSGTLARGAKNVELPTYLAAKRLLARAAAFGVASDGRSEASPSLR